MFIIEFQDSKLQGIVHDLTAALITSQEATHLPSALISLDSEAQLPPPRVWDGLLFAKAFLDMGFLFVCCLFCFVFKDLKVTR